jgi:hypothetical protein
MSSRKTHFLFQNTVDKLVQRANASLLIGTSSWKEQFIEAITVSPGKCAPSPSYVCNDRRVFFGCASLLCTPLISDIVRLLRHIQP